MSRMTGFKMASFSGLLVAAAAAVAGAQPMPVTEIGLLPGDMTVHWATNSQQDHSIAQGDSQTLVVWSDYRGRSSGSQTIQSDGDIFGIRLDPEGVAIDAVPFVIAGGMGLQRYPTVAWNGENWLVLYQSQDPVGGYFETQLRAVRVSPAGQVLDAVPILLPPTQFTPSTIGMTVAGQGGQWLITRCVYHDSGYGTYLAGQRIDAGGQLLDSAPLMLNDWVYGQTRIVVYDGEYLVVGPDWYNSATIKARRIGLDGQPIGASFTVPGMTIASDGGEYYVTWIANCTNIVGSRMTSTGTLLNPAGTVLCADPSVGYYHTNLAHDGTNWWFEWGAADTLHTMRISPSGTVLDPGGVPLPIEIGGSVNQAYGAQLAPRSGGGVLVAWYDLRVAAGYDANVFVLPVSAVNEPDAEVCASTGTASQRHPDLSPGPGNAAAVVFVSEAANDDCVLVHFLDASGQTPANSAPIEVYCGPTVGRAGMAFNGALYLIAFDVGASGLSPTQIKARRMNLDGSFLDAQAFDVMPGFNADVEALGENFLVAGARVAAYPQFIDLFASRIDGPTGALLDGPVGLLLHGGYVSGAPRVRTDGIQWLVAAHSMWSHDSSQGDAILAEVPATGPPSPAFNPTPAAGGSGDLDIAFSGSKYMLVWRMNSLSNANNYIAGRIMNVDGTFPPGYFTIAEAAGRQLRPTVAWDGNTFIVAWDDQRNQQAFFDARTDVFGTRVSEDGQVLDPAGFAIQSGPDGEASAAILPRPDGVSFVASTRFVTSAPFDSYRIGLTVLGEPAVEPCEDTADCADADLDGVRDSNCTSYACVAGSCLETFVGFGDMGGEFGACAPDGAVDANDLFHALNCFANTAADGSAGYPCEAAPPAAFNVDAGGAYGACAPDGVCDGNDGFHALNAFDGLTTCSCSPGGGPSPTDPVEPMMARQVGLRLSAQPSALRPGDFVQIDVHLDGSLPDLRGYQLHLGAGGGLAGALELVDIAVQERKDQVFAEAPQWQAFNVHTGQMLAGLNSPGIAAEAGAYLATFIYRVSDDAAGKFIIDVFSDSSNPKHRTFLFPTPAAGRMAIKSESATVLVAEGSAGRSRRSAP
jgi:hypothetical protein